MGDILKAYKKCWLVFKVEKIERILTSNIKIKRYLELFISFLKPTIDEYCYT